MREVGEAGMSAGRRLRRHWLHFGLAAILAVSLGCGSTTRLVQLLPEEQVIYRGTEPGEHRLSAYFHLTITEKGRATFYHFRDPQDLKSKEEIGQQWVYWPTGTTDLDKMKFGPRANAYAISADGRALLYFTDPRWWLSSPADHDRAPNPPIWAGQLHFFQHGRGDSVVAREISHWTNGHLDSLPPADAVVYREVDKHGHLAARGLWTLGRIVVRSFRGEVPDQAR
jgi:hypothetical protein